MSSIKIQVERSVLQRARLTHDDNGMALDGPAALTSAHAFDRNAPKIPRDGYFVVQCPGCEQAGQPQALLHTDSAHSVRWNDDYTVAVFVGIKCAQCRMSWSIEARKK